MALYKAAILSAVVLALLALYGCSDSWFSSDALMDPDKDLPPLLKVSGEIAVKDASLLRNVRHPKIGFGGATRAQVGSENFMLSLKQREVSFSAVAADTFKGGFPMRFSTAILALPPESSLMVVPLPSGGTARIFFGYICLFDDADSNGRIDFSVEGQTNLGDSLIGVSPMHYLLYIEDADFLSARADYAARHHNNQDVWQGLTPGYNIVKNRDLAAGWNGDTVSLAPGGDYGTAFFGLQKIAPDEPVVVTLLSDTASRKQAFELKDYFFLQHRMLSNWQWNFRFRLKRPSARLVVKMPVTTFQRSVSYTLVDDAFQPVDVNIKFYGLLDLGYDGCMMSKGFGFRPMFKAQEKGMLLETDTLDLSYSSFCDSCGLTRLNENYSITVSLPMSGYITTVFTQ